MRSLLLTLMLLGGLAVAAAAEEEPLFRNPQAPIEDRVNDLLGRLTLEEKIGLCHGNFQGGGIPRLGVGEIGMRDGRQGIRPLDTKSKTTALSCTLSLSCTWDPDAAAAFGRLLAEELLALEKHVLLAPCMNLMRSPLGGRNFENLGEDPYLAGRMAAGYIRGVQQLGVAACACIFVANDYEANRHFTTSNMDERTLREIHLLPFEMSIRQGNVWAVMAANNLYNCVHIAANRYLVQEILKDQLMFDGVMLTDWRAAYDPLPTALAGIDMTTGICSYVFGDGRLLAAARSGEIPEKLIDEKARRVLRLYVRSGVLDPSLRAKGELETPPHRALARRLAAQGMVLLKNDGRLLPLDAAKTRSILVTGPGAAVVPFGTGSGAVRPPFEVTPLQGLKSALGERAKIVHVGWTQKTAVVPDAAKKKKPQRALPKWWEPPSKDRLRRAARAADVVLFCVVGKPHGEQRDLDDLQLPSGQAEAIRDILAVNPHVAVVLLTGGPVSLEPWAERVPAILAAWYAGQATGDALADVLTGKATPGGKLSCTFGKRLEDYACHALGLWPPRLLLEKPPGSPGMKPEERRSLCAYAADYEEGVLMGYRWFDQKQIEPRFPFGHGLSYTTFQYDDLKCDTADDTTRLTFTLRNTGDGDGAEVAQVYLAPRQASLPRPPQELKGFAKVSLKAGESQQVEIALRPSAFAFYDVNKRKWKCEAGTYEIRVGSSSRDIRLRTTIQLHADRWCEY